MNMTIEMSEWHREWQNCFDETEVNFKKVCEEQIKDRRADVVLQNNYILEIQHSDIADSEVICRDKDYKIHNKNLIWLVHGDCDTHLEKMSDETYVLHFSKTWKFKSFSHAHEYVLLDMDNKIFKIHLKSVSKCKFHAKKYFDKNTVLAKLRDAPDTIWDLWEDTNAVKPKLIIKQKGAGNGKTYSIWKDISLNFDKSLYIITTKNHSAREVILQELNAQASKQYYHIVDNMIDLFDETYGKQYRVKYKHKYSERECTVLIGTIDSFFYSLAEMSHSHNDMFTGLTLNIINNGCDKMNQRNGTIRYAGINCNLNVMSELWTDECQDLHNKYYKAILRLISETGMDCIAIGDDLQSLDYIDNFLSCEETNHRVNIIREEPVNLNRRIKVRGMHDKINSMVPYKKYNLVPISVVEENLEDPAKDPIEIFHSDKNNSEKTIQTIMDLYEREVEDHDYKPNDFMFVFPILKNNILAGEIETRLNKFWGKRYNIQTYKEFAEVHKAEISKGPINLKTSVDKTRLVTIRTAKGDGRNVVFIIGCTEYNLKKVSKLEKNKIYESHFNVALTRAERQIYFGLEYNNDDIHRRFSEAHIDNTYIPSIQISINLNQLEQYISSSEKIELYSNIEWSMPEDKINLEKHLIDWKYHCIRRNIYIIYAFFEIFKFNKSNSLFKKSQLKVVLDIISKLKIKEFNVNQFYKYLRATKENLDCIPLCDLQVKGYESYFKKLKKLIQDIQRKYILDPLSIGSLTPLECSVLYYMIDIYQNKNFHGLTPSTMNSIIDSFENKNIIGDLLTESQNIQNILNELCDNILQFNDIKWNINHKIFLSAKTLDINIYNNFILIGNNETTVHHLVFLTDFNKLNEIDTLVKILLERFLIKHPKANEHVEIDNTDRFENKEIITYIIILKQNRYEKFKYDMLDETMVQYFQKALQTYFQKYNNMLYYCIRDIKANKKEWLEYNTPYEYLLNATCTTKKKFEFTNISYIRKFLEYLHCECEHNFQNVKLITDNKEIFEKHINKYISEMCKAYLNFEKNLFSDLDIEW